MKDLFKHIQQKFQSFLDGREEPDHSKADSLTSAIKEALLKKTAVHIIFQIQVLQGISSNMIRTASKLSLKILQKNVTRIIRIPDIRKVSFCSLNRPNCPKKIDLRKSEMSFLHLTLFY